MYGIALPMMSSKERIGVTISCSIVPCSFSRAMAIAVRITSDSISSTQMIPGTIKRTLRSSGLNHTRGSTCTSGWRAIIGPAPWPENTTSTALASVICPR